jgi:UDP-glucuronate 4-epimerase
VTDYYDPVLKRDRLAILAGSPSFVPVEGRLEDAALLSEAIARSEAEIVIHLAAQAGVRYSLEAPQSYIQSNVVGTANLLEALRQHRPRHLLFASTSSVYGGNTALPYAEVDKADGPVSLYAATKKSGEAMVHSYAHLFDIASTCLRFFTVYGPWGRPDMALFKFTAAMLEGRSIDVYGMGRMQRDFTYIDDLVAAIEALVERAPVRGRPVEYDSLSPVAPYRIVNIGGGRPVELLDFIAALGAALGVEPKIDLLPMQPGDMVTTTADTRLLQALIGTLPETSIEAGVAEFVAWYRERVSASR